MRLLTSISKGKAFLQKGGLRCANPRENDPERRCNKLLCKENEQGQIAGNYRCERCGQTVEVTLVPPKTV